MTKGAYTKPGRLSDILALIQVLAFDPDTHRSESDIIEKELGVPASSPCRVIGKFGVGLKDALATPNVGIIANRAQRQIRSRSTHLRGLVALACLGCARREWE